MCQCAMLTWLWLYAPVALPGIVARISFAREIESALQSDQPSDTHKNFRVQWETELVLEGKGGGKGRGRDERRTQIKIEKLHRPIAEQG